MISHILFVHAMTGFDRNLHRITSENIKLCLFWKTRQRGDWITIKVIQQKDASHNEVASLIRYSGLQEEVQLLQSDTFNCAIITG